MGSSEFDAVAEHRHFSAACFNRTWEYIEKPVRTAEDDEQMLLCALASLWHWTQRDDCGPQQLSIGHWLISRVFCLLGKLHDSQHHGERCLHYSETLAPFYKAYAHEALARIYAANPLSDGFTAGAHLDQARALLREITDGAERAMLKADLSTIKGWEY